LDPIIKWLSINQKSGFRIYHSGPQKMEIDHFILLFQFINVHDFLDERAAFQRIFGPQRRFNNLS